MESLRDILPALAPSDALPPDAAAALAWQLAAGAELAARARCCGLRHGALWLAPLDPAARTQIESVAPELLRSLNRLLAGGALTTPCRRFHWMPTCGSRAGAVGVPGPATRQAGRAAQPRGVPRQSMP